VHEFGWNVLDFDCTLGFGYYGMYVGCDAVLRVIGFGTDQLTFDRFEAGRIQRLIVSIGQSPTFVTLF